MKNRFLSRKKKLQNLIEVELKQKLPDVNNIVSFVDIYEKDNIASIEKLKRDKKVELNRINGALRQSIDAHGTITKPLIGSVSKRIYGALLDNIPKSKFKLELKQVIIAFIIGMAIGFLI